MSVLKMKNRFLSQSMKRFGPMCCSSQPYAERTTRVPVAVTAFVEHPYRTVREHTGRGVGCDGIVPFAGARLEDRGVTSRPRTFGRRGCREPDPLHPPGKSVDLVAPLGQIPGGRTLKWISDSCVKQQPRVPATLDRRVVRGPAVEETAIPLAEHDLLEYERSLRPIGDGPHDLTRKNPGGMHWITRRPARGKEMIFSVIAARAAPAPNPVTVHAKPTAHGSRPQG